MTPVSFTIEHFLRLYSANIYAYKPDLCEQQSGSFP